MCASVRPLCSAPASSEPVFVPPSLPPSLPPSSCQWVSFPVGSLRRCSWTPGLFMAGPPPTPLPQAHICSLLPQEVSVHPGSISQVCQASLSRRRICTFSLLLKGSSLTQPQGKRPCLCKYQVVTVMKVKWHEFGH